MNQLRKQPSKQFHFLLPLFVGLGVGLGALSGNVGVGMAIGAGIGTVVSLLVWWWDERNTP